jgi:hypothetical protein
LTAALIAVVLCGCVALAGCMASVQPIMPQDAATALAQKSIRRFETTNLDVYYPADRHDEAIRSVSTSRVARASSRRAS